MAVNNLSQRVSELSQRLEGLKIKCVSDPANASEVLDDALDSLQASLEELSVVNEELVAANEELAASNEELRATTEELQNEIKNREQAEEALLESEKKYRILTENTPGVIQRFDRDLRILYISPQVEGATGMTPEKFIGKTNEELGMPPELCTIWNNLFHKVSASRDAHEIIFDFPVPKGIKTYLLKVVPEFATDGSIKSYLGISIDITNQMMAEKALKESEEKFRGLFDSMNEAIQLCELVRDDEGRPIDNILLDVNPAYETHSGFTRDQVIGRRIKEILPVVEQVWLDRYDEVVRTGKPLHFEEFNASLDKWFDVSASPMKGDRFAAIFTDITERKKAEEKLREQAKMLDLGHILVRDMDSKIIFWNTGAEQLYGFTKDEAIGTVSHELFQTKFPEPLAKIEDKLIKEGDWDGDLTHTKHDGTIITVASHWVLYRNRQGKPTAIIEVNNDITQLKQAEERLRLAYSRLQTFFDHRIGGIGIVIANANGCILQANDYYLSILGCTRDDLLSGQVDWRKMTPPEWLPADEHALTQLKEQGVCDTYEKEYERLDGTRVPVLITDAMMPGDSGDILAFVMDITERKKAEEALQKAKDELELRVQERTADLVKTNDELLKAKDAAEEAVRAKAAFLANMSHELRTPMNSIIGFTSLLLMEPLPSEYKDWLETMRMNGDALLALISDVLDFSKMEKEKMELEIHPFDLRQRIEESLDLVSTKAAEKGLDLAYIMDSNVPEAIISDSARLRQVLANLLSNAVKFTDSGDILVQISSKREGAHHELHFAVRDTGIGMPQDQMSKLFQPFSQIDTAPSRLNEGTGLGLAISKKLVELMGGRIWAESEVGKGSTFHFTIKAKAAPIDKAEKLPTGPQPQLARRNVLIVDDNNTIRRILGRQTLSWGMIPFVVSSGHEALDMVQKGVAIDVAILDVGMPEMNGITLAETIRAYRKDMPFVMLTSVGQRIPQDLSAVSLTKPIRPMQLYDALTNVLAGRPIQEQNPDKIVDQASVSPLRILLAEDNVPSQKITSGMLKKLGYRADLAANGVEVIQALEHLPYDVVLMDIRMPEMDGYEATKQIRQRWPDNGPRIIAITAYALEGDKEKCLEAGMDDYIGKPVRMNDLADALNRCPTPPPRIKFRK